MLTFTIGLIVLSNFGLVISNGIDSLSMYPFDSETREVQSLDGVWTFRITNYSVDAEIGFKQKWFTKSLSALDKFYERMPVPSSFNDITENREIRDFVGWSWYDRTFFVPKIWKSNDKDVLLRFGSVNYKAVVYLNGVNVFNHTGGHLPFQGVVTQHLKYGESNHVTVAVFNQLSAHTLPQGSHNLKTGLNSTKFMESSTNFDFFNYAGIQRSVKLYQVPTVRIVDINIKTEVATSNGIIDYNVAINGNTGSSIHTLNVEVFDQEDKLVTSVKGPFQGKLTIKNANLWWPFTMHSSPGYQYRLVFTLLNNKTETIDSYHQKVGIRTVKISDDKKQFLVNGKNFYFRGFGKHEEYNIRGRSLDPVMIVKDFNLIKWIGANSFRTSHYPYSEELMDEADSQGIVVIDECPAVAIKNFDKNIYKLHMQTIRELIDRDKNRPSVFMWSVANEPSSDHKDSKSYFHNITQETRKLDSTRPITAATNRGYSNCLMSQYLDVIMLNRYYAWYSDNGYPEVIQNELETDFTRFYEKFKKPIMISEYGADTVSGMHSEPAIVFTEDYQSEVFIEFHKGFDVLRSKNFFIGEHVWNFADFMTVQGITRVGGNKKGIFTRERQPKAVARLLRCRYWSLSNLTSNEIHQKGFSYCPKVVY